MAEDLVLSWQNILRDSLTDSHSYVNDLMLLEVATKLGAVDPYSLEPEHEQYRTLDDVSESQIEQILDSMQESIKKQRIDPMTPIGPIAATSISEPMYQGVMRTFHYAGVLTKKDPFDLLNIEVGKTPNKNALIALALPPESRFDKSKADLIAKSLQRTVLSKYCGVVKNHVNLRQLVISDAFAKSQKKLNEFPDEDKYDLFEKKISLKEGLEETIEVAGNPKPKYAALLEEHKKVSDLVLAARMEADSLDSFFIYLKTPSMLNPSLTKEELKAAMLDPNSSDYDELVKPNLSQDNLEEIIDRLPKRSDGGFRTIGDVDNPLHLIFKNADVRKQTIEVDGEEIQGVVLTIPFLTRPLQEGLEKTLMRLEYCNGCKAPATTAKLVHKAGREKKVKVSDDSWDSGKPKTEYDSKLATSILEEAGLIGNPPLTDEQLEDFQDEAVGLVEIDMSTASRYDFELAELGRKLRYCSPSQKGCGMGWYNVTAAVVQFNFGLDYRDYNEFEEGLIKDYKREDLDSQIEIVQHIGEIEGEGGSIFPKDIDFLTYPGVSRKGQNSDYPICFAHGGRIINDPILNEYYILVTYKDVSDGRMNNFKGHLMTAANSDFIDFNRTSCSDAAQVEMVLGIEAARTQLAHNMFNAQGNGDTIAVAGNSSPVHFKHYLLLSDALCNGPVMSNARAGSASVSGLAATKGSTVKKVLEENKETGEFQLVNRNFQSVLAQAYERQTQVLLGAAPMGLIDDLSHPMSAQISGQPDRWGTLGPATEGRYASVPTKPLQELKNQLASAMLEMNDYAEERTGHTWIGDTQSIMVNLDGGGQSNRPEIQQILDLQWKTRRDELLADPDFVNLVEQWGDSLQEFYDLLEGYKLSEPSVDDNLKPRLKKARKLKQKKITVSKLERLNDVKHVEAPRRTKEQIQELNERSRREGSGIHYGMHFDRVPFVNMLVKQEVDKLRELVEKFTSG